MFCLWVVWCYFVLIGYYYKINMYNVVEFDDGSLAIVLDKWYTPEKRNTLWPPIREYHRAMRNLSTAAQGWDKFAIRRTFYETDNLEIAKCKLKLAEEFSDINTGDEGIDTCRRNIRKPNRLLVLDDSSDDELNKSHESERPPKIYIKSIPGNTVKRSIERSPALSQDSQKSSCSLSYPSAVEERRSQASQSKTISSDDKISYSLFSEQPQNKCVTQTKSRADELLMVNLDQSVQKKILENLLFIREQNKEILTILKSPGTSTGHQAISTGGMPMLPVDLPLSKLNEVEVLEEYLKKKENFTALSSYLISLGGKDISSRTNRILRQILTDSTSSSFNFLGSRNKQSFSTLKLCRLIVDSVKTGIPSSTEKDIEDAIKVWLKHAPERQNKKRKPDRQ